MERVGEQNRPALTKEQLETLADQIHLEISAVRMGDIPPVQTGEGVQVALGGLLAGYNTLMEYSMETRVLEAYRDAFLISAGAKNPVIITPRQHVINLGVEPVERQ
ncbi:MAG: hypothetical protein Q7S44_01895 [bacterium]|nr:hypothetical protein [bacterium]